MLPRGGPPSVGTVLRALPAAVRAQLRAHDLALHGAAVTFYAAISGVPMLLLAGRLATLLVGRDRLLDLADAFGRALPDQMGAAGPARAFIASTAGTSWWVAVVVIFPASLYGEGLRRAYVSLAGADEKLAGWRGRLALLPVLGVAPLLLLAVLGISPMLADLFSHGTGGAVLGVYIALNVDWLVLTVPMTWSFRVMAPDPPGWGLALVGGTTTAAFVSGFLQGFALFLALPVDVGAPFGGLTAVGVVTAGLFWIWLLHLVVLLGYVATRCAAQLRAGVVGREPAPDGRSPGGVAAWVGARRLRRAR